MTDRRHPHIPFDPTLVEGALGGRDVIHAELLPEGKCNTNYKLTLAEGESLVLRLRARGDREQEQYVMNLVRGHVPVPDEVASGDNWSLYTWIEGEALANHMELCGRAAEALARIASLRFSSSGWIQADGSVSPFTFGTDDESEASGDFVSVLLARDDVGAWIGAEAAAAIPAIMGRESGRIEEACAESRLVHGDFNPTNVLVNDGAVSGVLDWEFAHAGTPYMDIGNLLRHADVRHHAEIRAGLEAGGMAVRDDWIEIAELIDVSSQLEFLTSSRSDAFKRQCVSRIHAFVNAFEGNAK